MNPAALVLACLPVGDLLVTFEAPELYVPGVPYVARIEVTAKRGDAALKAWQLTPAGFDVDGSPLGRRTARDEISVAEGDVIVASIDLSEALGARDDFRLTLADSSDAPLEVDALSAVAEGADFMSMNEGALHQNLVFLRTNQGDMLFEVWPGDAPNHVRNFLDLAHSRFYEDTTFHRVMPGFMIQGGDPEGTGNGNGPRTLRAEFNERRHDRGVLSMARTGDPDSASCQFFVIHADSPQLDGQYTAFGRMLVGFDALDRIVRAPGRPISGRGDVTPFERQIIERAVVVLAESKRR